MQLKVIKTDGSVEEYLHTKIIGTISTALSAIGRPDIYVAEELAEAVTFYLYKRQHRRTATSSEIFSIIKAVLTATRHEEAAVALSEHHFERRLKRSRIEVMSIDIEKLADAEQLCKTGQLDDKSLWDKAKIVSNLMEKNDVSRQTARMIASMVEEKIFNMGLTLVPASLIKQLVLGDAAAVLRAQRQLQLQT
jgi:transcriptional regulator NrdR family protein